MVQTMSLLRAIRLVCLFLILGAALLLVVDASFMLLGRPGFLKAFANVSVFSALGFFFTVQALFILYSDFKFHRNRTLGLLFSILVLCLGLVQIGYFIFKASQGQFEVAYTQTLERLGLSTPIISFNLTLLGAALVCAFPKESWPKWISQFLSLLVVLLASLALLTFLYRAEAEGLTSERFTRSSFFSAIVTFALGLLTGLQTTEVGLTRLVFMDSLGGRLVRRLLPATILIQVLFEFLRARYDFAGTYEEPIFKQLLAISNSFLLLGGITFVAASLDRLDQARKEALKALTRLNEDLEHRVAERTLALEKANTSLTHEIRERHDLEHEFAEVREKVAQRLGRIIHDHLSQDLIGLTFQLKALQQRSRSEHPALAEELSILETQSRHLVEHVRTIARQVYPPELAGSGLMESLLELMRNKDGGSGLRCHFECEEPVSHPDPQVESHLFYIAQEAVENAIRHGGGSSIWVRLESTDDHLDLAVEDDGPGLPKSGAGPGIGLRIMQSRARMIGGTLHLGPREGGGTRLLCRIALKHDKPHGISNHPIGGTP